MAKKNATKKGQKTTKKSSGLATDKEIAKDLNRLTVDGKDIKAGYTTRYSAPAQ